MRKILLSLTLLFLVIHLAAQPIDIDAAKAGFKGNVHWVKRTWYNAVKNGDKWEADKSKVPNIYMRPNQLIQYNKAGKMMACMDYKSGTDDVSGPTYRYYWTNGKLTKSVHENDAYEIISSTTYTYDNEGNEIRSESKPGPGDKLGFALNYVEEYTWSGKQLKKHVTKNDKGEALSTRTYTYDSKDRKIREDYLPAGLYSAKTFEYDDKGNLVKDTYLDKAGKPSTVWAYEYNIAGKPVKRIMTSYYQDKKQNEEIQITTYNSQGDKIKQVTTRDGKQTNEFIWHHSYDEKGNRIQTVHITNGKPEAVEVLELRYY